MRRRHVMRRALVVGAVILSPRGIPAQATEAPRLVTPAGHGARINALRVSSDGSLLATASLDRTARVWQLANGRELISFATPAGPVLDVWFAGGDSTLITSSQEQSARVIRLWDIRTGAFRDSVHLPASGVVAPRATLNGDLLVARSDTLGRIELWSVAAHRQLDSLHLPSRDGPLALEWSPDGTVLTAAAGDSSFEIRFPAPGRHVVAATAPARNGASRAVDVTALANTLGATAGALFPDRERVVLGYSSGRVEVRTAAGDSVARQFGGRAMWITRLALSPSGAFSAVAGNDGNIHVWHTATGDPARTLHGLGRVQAIAFLGNPSTGREGDTLLVVACDSQPRVRLWNLRTGAVARRLAPAGMIRGIAVSPDGESFAAVGAEEAVWVWDHGAPIPVRVALPKSTGSQFLTHVAYLGRDTLIIANGAGRISVVGIPSRSAPAPLIALDSSTGAVAGMAVSRDGHRLAVIRMNGRLAVLDLRTRAVVASPRSLAPIGAIAHAITFADSSGSTLVAALGPSAYVLATDGQHYSIARILRDHAGDVTGLAVSPNFRALMTSSQDGATRIWATADYSLRLTRIELDSLDWIAAAPDGRFDGSGDGIRQVHYARRLETFALDNFADRYLTPGLTGLALADSASHAPDIRTGFPSAPRLTARYDSARARFTIEARDVDPSAWTVQVYQNGTLVGSSDVETSARAIGQRCAASRDPICLDFTIHPVTGENFFEAEARSTGADGIASERTRVRGPTMKAERTGRLVILGVGISRYSRLPEDALPTAAADVRAAIAALSAGHSIYRSVTTKTLFDGEATRERMLAAFAELTDGEVVGPEDVFVLLYSGHGVMAGGRFYIVPADAPSLTDAASLRASAISGEALQASFNRIRALKRVLIMDACHSGAALAAGLTAIMKTAGAPTGPDEPARSFGDLIPMLGTPRMLEEERAVLRLGRSTGVVTIAATGTLQVASEVEALHHGVFTYALLHALGDPAAPMPGEDPQMRHERTVLEVIASLEKNVPELSRLYKSEPQYPRSLAHGQNFPLVIR